MEYVRRIVWGMTAAYWLGLFVLTHIPTVPPVIVPVTDKTVHFIGYFVLAWLGYASLRLAGWKQPGTIVLAVGLAYGAMDEWLQIPVGRSCELADWYADAAGVAAAVALAGILDAARSRVGPAEALTPSPLSPP
jgi:VanZ family protein